MKLETFFEKFDQFADAPDAVAKMRELVLELAVQGRLTSAFPRDGAVPSVVELRESAAALANSLGLRSPKESVEEAEPPFDVPSHWRWMALADIGAAQTGTTPSKADHDAFNGDVPFIKPADILPNSIDYSNESLTRHGAESGSRLAPSGSLLMVCIGTIGKCNLIERECAFNQQINSLTPVDAVDSRYLMVAARSRSFQDAAWKKSSSTTIAILNKGKWLSIPVPLPPLAEQKRIVAKVDELMALCDRLEAQQQEREAKASHLARASLARFADAPTPANLSYLFHSSFIIHPSDLRKSILTLAVQGKLVPQDPNDEPAFASKDAEFDFDRPPGWLSGTVFDLAVLKSGNSFPNEEELAGGEYLYVKVSDMNLPENQHEITTSSRFINPKSRDLRGLIPANAIIFPKRGGAIATNKKRLVKAPIFVDSNTMAMICPPFIELRYLHVWFSGIDLWELNSGTSVPQINNKDIGPLVIPVPPLAEQRRIVAKAEQLMALVDALETQLAASRASAANLLSALVAELTGTPNDGKVAVPSASTTGRRGRPRKS